ncbi:acyltransferase [Hydrogenophaga borbori]|uniref:Acyltransferase n=1 Tax=Hydrogenophaga borbori TaxID=2294117 RepID=A0A372EKL0_9BURK|nr:acyltransferase family protein [Hydrogenophaga borbori]RFP79619.1 acyltransferase [Hydrogenophaga borbori]
MNRSALIDSLKALASQLIVLHHLSLYAPMTDWIADAWPRLVQFLYEDGRYAVQPFLVIGGFLTAQSLSKRRDLAPVPLIWQRYLRLVPQFLVALALVVLATGWLGPELAQHDWVSPLPSVGQFLAHLFFLQDVLGVPSLSAGAWYVAIDLQLFGLFALLACFAARSSTPLADSFVPLVVAVATVASIEVFSRRPTLDVWAIYFLSAYGLGALAAWARGGARAALCWWLVAALLALDWLQDPRARPILALATALALYAGSHLSWRAVLGPVRRAVEHLSDVSYSVFVCHFAVIIVVSGLWERLDRGGLGQAWLWTALAWAAVLLLGTGVQRLCDRWVPAFTRTLSLAGGSR